MSLPAYSGYAFTGEDTLHHDIYAAISPAQTASLQQPGKVILVTGASRGIGRAIAVQYAHAGVSSIHVCARSAANLSATESAILAANPSVKVTKHALDVADEQAVKACADAITQQDARLDVLVNNAGISAPWVPLVESDPATWFKDFEVNIKGPYLFLHFFLPLLARTAEQQGATTSVVNVSSIASLVMMPGSSSYGMTKLALNRLVEYAAMEGGPKGVTVTAVHPGGVPTDLALSEPSLEGLLNDTPELSAGFFVWLTSGDKAWLGGRYLSAHWDVDALLGKKEEIVSKDLLKMRMAV